MLAKRMPMEPERLHIMVGVDFSPDSLRALDRAVDLVRRTGGELDLVHVHPHTAATSLRDALLAHDEIAGFDGAREQLAALRATHLPADLAGCTHLRIGDPKLGLLEAIDELHPDVVVTGSHGRGAVQRALLGSVSEYLVRHSPVPVLVVPPQRDHVADEPALAAPVGDLAWSCSACGYMRRRADPIRRCRQCGASPASWESAPMSIVPADAGAPAVGHGAGEDEPRIAQSEPAATFATAPAGVEGTDTNPELRLRF
jgi:nucleotide-binding universal stress UspA family protein